MSETRRRLPLVDVLAHEAVVEAVRVATAERLQGLRARASVGELAGLGFGWLDESLAQAEGRVPRSAPAGCADGCAYCCHLKVTASPLEALHLVETLRKTLDREALARVSRRVRETDRITHGKSVDERVNLRAPCPLLEAGRCVAYEARPLRCRGANAFDPAGCRAGFEDPESDLPISFYGPQRMLADAVSTGLSVGCLTVGLDGSPLELVAGLKAALADPDPTIRFLRGEPVFRSAVDAEAMGR